MAGINNNSRECDRSNKFNKRSLKVNSPWLLNLFEKLWSFTARKEKQNHSIARINVQRQGSNIVSRESIRANEPTSERSNTNQCILIFPRKPNCRSVITHLNHTTYSLGNQTNLTITNLQGKKVNQSIAGINERSKFARSIEQIQRTIV